MDSSWLEQARTVTPSRRAARGMALREYRASQGPRHLRTQRRRPAAGRSVAAPGAPRPAGPGL